MIEFLDQIDKEWLLALNNDYSDFWDYFMYFFSDKLTWIPLYLSIIFVIVRVKAKTSWLVILGLILSIVIADQIASGLLKDWVARPRPSHDPEISNQVVTVFGYTGGAYGFASSHAANSFALAILTILLFKNKIYSFFILLWAVLNSYSRIYLGVHYLGDILAGTLIGVLAGCFVYFILKKIKNGVVISSEQNMLKSKQSILYNIPSIVFLMTVGILLIVAGVKS